jgi:transposase
MTNGVGLPVPGVTHGVTGRRSFSEEDKQRIVDETSQPGMSVTQVARRYRIAPRVLFRWKEAFKPGPEPAAPAFAPVQIMDAAPLVEGPAAASVPVIVERPAPAIEVELVGGRRVRFERDADPETVRRLVALLEGGAS